MISDQVLIQRCLCSDDRYAYSQLVRRHQSKLRQMLWRLCDGDHARADDLAQETFIQAYKSLAGFRQQAQFSTWLYRIAFNKFLSSQRKRSELSNSPLIENTDSADPSSPSVAMDIQRAMQRLSDQQRQAVLLNLGEGFSHQEVADMMNIPVGTVKTHILRARKILQTQLADWRGETVDG